MDPVQPAQHAAVAKQELRARARSLSPATPDESAAVVDRLATLSVLDDVHRACVYLAMSGEVDPAALPTRLPGIDWTTTRTGHGPLLTVHPLDAPRERHRLGYAQPVAGSPTVEAHLVDVWLVPGLAFDLEGNRLGHGAGYYDRLLGTAAPDATFVGVTLERYLATALPRQPHDQAMHLVVTESRVVEVQPG